MNLSKFSMCLQLQKFKAFLLSHLKKTTSSYSSNTSKTVDSFIIFTINRYEELLLNFIHLDAEPKIRLKVVKSDDGIDKKEEYEKIVVV